MQRKFSNFISFKEKETFLQSWIPKLIDYLPDNQSFILGNEIRSSCIDDSNKKKLLELDEEYLVGNYGNSPTYRLVSELREAGFINFVEGYKIELTEKGKQEKNRNKIKTDNVINPQKMKKIFISHSSSDVEYVEQIIFMLEAIEIPSTNIFCSSFEGYGTTLGEDFLDRIKKELNNDVFVIFVLSENFYASPISLCEMGATWINTSYHVPILIPPFDYKDIKGVIPNTHAMKINESEKYNTLKGLLEEKFQKKPISFSIWEKKRKKIITEIDTLLQKKSGKPKKVSLLKKIFTVL